MIEINLLPKEFQKKAISISFDRSLIYALAGAVALILLMVIYSIYQKYEISGIKEKIVEARSQTDAYNDEITQIDELNRLKNDLMARISAIEILDENRAYWVDLFGDLAVRVPAHVWLTGLKQAGAGEKQEIGKIKGQPIEPSEGKSSIEGRAFSLNSLAAFLIQLHYSGFFKDISVSQIKLEDFDGKAIYTFVINCDLAGSTVEKTTETMATDGANAGKTPGDTTASKS